LISQIFQQDSETVEKVPKQILRKDAEKNALTECTTINDLTIMRGHETTPKPHINYIGSFSTVSADCETEEILAGGTKNRASKKAGPFLTLPF
jgi:hypothetical protein